MSMNIHIRGNSDYVHHFRLKFYVIEFYSTYVIRLLVNFFTHFAIFVYCKIRGVVTRVTAGSIDAF